MRLDRTGKTNPISLLALVLVLGGAIAILKPSLPSMGSDSDEAEDCVLDRNGLCVEGLPESHGRLLPGSPGPILSEAEACTDVGYLCDELDEQPRIAITRWRDFSGTIVVHVPTPRVQDANTARRLQRAAAAGVRLWNGQPFPVLVDERGNREAHFRVTWLRGLSGNQIGVARTRWGKDTGLSVESIHLATMSPFDSQVIEPRQIRLTAAHEMGHALGLPHSNSPRDVMYPTNTATSLSAQDYLTMEALYGFEDGTEIVR